MSKIRKQFSEWNRPRGEKGNLPVDDSAGGGIIIAASGAGKSTYVKQKNDPSILDGDTLVTYPDNPQWWKDSELNAKTQELTTGQIVDYAKTHPDAIILWYCDYEMLLRKAKASGTRVAFVILPPEEAKRNEKARAKDIAEKDAALYPSEVVSENDDLGQFAAQTKSPTFDTFDKAVSFLSTEKKTQSETQDSPKEDTSEGETDKSESAMEEGVGDAV
jgi:hypothetical protein